MKERPILFSAPMVRAVLKGSKTQARRALRDQPCELLDFNRGALSIRVRRAVYQAFNPKFPPVRCPYGKPGDRLWVREAWRVGRKHDGTKPSDLSPRSMTVEYEAGGYACNSPWSAGEWHSSDCAPREHPKWVGKLRPPIHMPRWASRITLEITGVRVERLQDISEADAKAEGAPELLSVDGGYLEHPMGCYRDGFQHLWTSINGPGSWDTNPWVWVVEFRRLDVARLLDA